MRLLTGIHSVVRVEIHLGREQSFILGMLAMMLFKERLWLGASYRSNMQIGMENLQDNLNQRNAVAFLLEVFATNNLRLGYAYDHSMNVLSDYRNNSHEISVGYYIAPRSVTMKNPRWF